MEVDVVDEEQVRIVAVREQPGDFLGERREMLRGGAFRREPRGFDLEDPPRLVISSRVKPWRAARKLRGSEPSDGGPSGM
jgi:hypothetical protein